MSTSRPKDKFAYSLGDKDTFSLKQKDGHVYCPLKEIQGSSSVVQSCSACAGVTWPTLYDPVG